MPNYPYDELDTKIDRSFVQGLNQNFDEVEQDIRALNEPLKEVLDGNFDGAALATEFETRAQAKLEEIQPEFYEFQTDTTAQLAQKASQENVLFLKERYSKLIKYPSVVTNHKLPINIYNRMNEFYTDLNPRDHKPVRANTYYVNPAVGSDSNNGTSATSAFKTIHKALSMTGDNEIILNPGVYYYNDGWKGYDPAKGVSVICKKGVATLTNEAYPRRWVEDATYKGMYSTASVQNGEDFLALNPDLRYVVNGYHGLTSGGSQLTAQSFANIQNGTVGVSVGSGTVYIRLPHNLDPNKELSVKYSRDNVICKANDLVDSVIYMENIVAEYGNTSPLTVSASTDNSKILLVNVKAMHARFGNGLQITSNGLAILWGCEASYSWMDGINYQMNTGISGSVNFDVVEVNCKGHHNGRDTGGTNNGSTIHGSIRIIRLNGDFQRNQNRSVHDVGSGWSFNVGVISRFSEENDADFATRSSAINYRYKMWLVGCEAGKLEAQPHEGGSTIYKELGMKYAEQIGDIQEFDPYF